MEPNIAISMTMYLIISNIFLYSFASEAPVHEDSKLVNPNDYFGSGINTSDLPQPGVGVSLNIIDANKIPALKSSSMSIVRGDFDPLGGVPIHIHPHSNELVVGLKGSIHVGFLVPCSLEQPTCKSQHVTKILNPGDVFIIPEGRIHYLQNMDRNASATAFTIFSNIDFFIPPLIGRTIFAADPPVDDRIIENSFRLDKTAIEDVKMKFN
ncbi:hypothetical protein CQW23_30614 [Capsicum baccatum]|uniref:Cupin type-1 domain-containing protein n=1 Tax=Capsicum baccatum TaxID=33114 RepID=A0A2G2V9X0_CAPBA|nr:hypothetical protein CQW23_30614 [Capsicum baccatum]